MAAPSMFCPSGSTAGPITLKPARAPADYLLMALAYTGVLDAIFGTFPT
jgi:hypothetical protein